MSKIVDTTEVSSFPPIVDKQSEFLILGTMPGKESLATREYYAKKGNIFWDVISNIFNDGKALSTYEQKVECVKKNHIAIWDVLCRCQREGSLDKDITDEEHNDIDNFLKKYPNIKKIVFNGQKAQSYYTPSINFSVALSTSPANCQFSIEQRINSWKDALKHK